MSLINTVAEKNYRLDIDGLRAIAVISVFLHHLNLSILPGGYIGVDVFFVISGFLITGQIIDEKERGNFSIKNFYQRRINRIIPALLTVIITSLAVGFIILSPADLVLLTRSAVNAIFGLSNIFFWKEYGSYFSENSAEAPLLHTWSLGVEEQFYFIWPLLLILIFKLLRKNAFVPILIVFFIAVAVSEIGTKFATSASYYLLPTRFFELTTGGLLTLICRKFPPRDSAHSNYAFFIGFATLILSFFVFEKITPFPGLMALIPCVSTALLIWSGSLPVSAIKIITFKPLIFIGILSYSLYLWHWPLIAYAKYIGVVVDVYVGLLIVCIAFILSWATSRFVELPMRKSGSTIKFKDVLTYRLILPAIILLAINVVVVILNGVPSRFSPEIIKFEEAQKFKPNELRADCHVPTAHYDYPLLDRCKLGSNKLKPDGILLGDSFANHFSGMIDVIAKQDNLAIVDYTMDGCPPIDGYDSGKVASYAKRCRVRNELAYSEIEKRKFSHVILASNWPEIPEAGPLLVRSIERAQRTGAHVTIIFKNEPIEDGNTCPIRNAMYGQKKICKKMPKGQPLYFENLKKRFPNVSFIDPNKEICDAMGCDPVLDGVLIYRDSVHLNDTGSRLLGRLLVKGGVSLLGPAR